jgi:hypothetical protein
MRKLNNDELYYAIDNNEICDGYFDICPYCKKDFISDFTISSSLYKIENEEYREKIRTKMFSFCNICDKIISFYDIGMSKHDYKIVYKNAQ